MSARTQLMFAIPALDHGGPDRVLFEILTHLDRSRFASRLVVTQDSGRYLSRLPSDIPVDVVRGVSPIDRRYPVMQLVHHVRKHRPDVVFGMQRMILSVGMAMIAFPRETKVIFRQANDLSADFSALRKQSLVKHRLAHRMVTSALDRAEAVVCQSTAMRDDLRAQLRRSDHLVVISNPISIEATARKAAATVSIAGRPSLVSVGRLAPQKGFDILLDAMPAIRRRFPGAHLTIYGDGPDRGELENQRDRLGIAEHVTLAGFADDVLPRVRAADLFVLASRYEGFPNAALEAMACGTPIVLTHCPGANAELVVPGRNGRLAASIDPVTVAAAVEQSLDELAHYDRAWISEDCAERYSTGRIVADYQRLFASVVANRPRHAA